MEVNMLTKLTKTRQQRRKEFLKERVAFACTHACGGECAVDPDNLEATLNLKIRIILP